MHAKLMLISLHMFMLFSLTLNVSYEKDHGKDNEGSNVRLHFELGVAEGVVNWSLLLFSSWDLEITTMTRHIPACVVSI